MSCTRAPGAQAKGMEPMSAPSRRRPPGRPRGDDAPASLEDILALALRAFATYGYDGVSLRTLNRELGASHNLLNGRFGSKEGLWYATIDWASSPWLLGWPPHSTPLSPTHWTSCGSPSAPSSRTAPSTPSSVA
jgi:hypothetical protein